MDMSVYGSVSAETLDYRLVDRPDLRAIPQPKRLGGFCRFCQTNVAGLRRSW